ncbi:MULTISPECIES: DUF2797 domain-containing protein [Halolamina]|uniref:DUF2797 domain-containing protein n=1 Tax=Halolamina pelagica TaxID=699431 RepID=A0A1I5QTT7_9EURY|nr:MULTISPECIES: DUF2797 domain-containing protein [Halolamina]NHX35541.1 DUF2797 domain-containing protein [Halolamina sp. R1-12]SFP49718.1 Protein of unknown function [Halolamina pelagica]
MQFVGYDAGDGGLLLARDGDVEYVDLPPGTEIAYQLGERHCAGVVEEDGHAACDADAAPYCDAHSQVWVCAKCTGKCLKDEMDCFEDHAVYLAAFAPDTFKVGVTREWRLETRLLEQGADRAAHVRTVDDGRAARRIEAGIAERIPDRIRVPTKIDGLGRSVDDDAWAALLSDFDPIETFDFDYRLDLDGRPVTETMATGTVRGVKGRILLLDRAGSTYAVDMRKLVGYEVREGTSEREMQSSLGAFG